MELAKTIHQELHTVLNVTLAIESTVYENQHYLSEMA